jgi:hypothetical protein
LKQKEEEPAEEEAEEEDPMCLSLFLASLSLARPHASFPRKLFVFVQQFLSVEL